MYEQLKLQNQLCFRLYTAARLITQIYHPYLEPLGITYSQYLVLLVLWEEDNQKVNDIAHRLYLETNTITPLLQRMEQHELIKRQKVKSDGRQCLVSLTEKGIQLEEKAKDIPNCLAMQLTQQISNADDITGMIPSLDSLINGLS